MTSGFIQVSNISVTLPNGKRVFNNQTFSITRRVSALVGRNGVGKSLLAKIMAEIVAPDYGKVQALGQVRYVPQAWNGCTDDSVAQVLGIEDALKAMKRIEQGIVNEEDFQSAEKFWGWRVHLKDLCAQLQLNFIPNINRAIGSYSGGEQLSIMLLSALWQQPDIFILDEPTNHLDAEVRMNLMHWINNSKQAFVLISHDPELLMIAEEIFEINEAQIHHVNGNYEVYQDAREQRILSQTHRLEEAQKEQKKAIAKAQQAMEKQQQRVSRGKKKANKRGLSAIEIGGAKENASSSIRKQKIQHNRRVEQARVETVNYQSELEHVQPIGFELPESYVPQDKTVLELVQCQWGFNQALQTPLDFMIQGTRRIHLQGKNGSGKSTLLQTIAGIIQPFSGVCTLKVPATYLDQHCHALNQNLTALENYIQLCPGMPEQFCRDRLAWLRFRGELATRYVAELSGGDKMKLALACTLLGPKLPQLLLLDEPSNHLDFDSRAALLAALNKFKGAMIIASHDPYFVRDLGCDSALSLES